ncbi:MAG: Stk1 family PASTA domain-containing Ser/Thr kinase [Oscillospiraceae bacterium]|nr:Stk1 family PASTA domain-containing Ser/Thr kinase [Oscillospiraceae bacterium]
MDNNIGKRLDGRYELLELIGVGGMADIYKARDMVEDKIVAAKILKNELAESEDFLRRFRNESKAIALLSHPNIVKIFDVGFSEKVQFIVMEYIDGITLTEYIERQGVLKWRDALHFVTQILRALQHAHDRGIVHRDIKSQNVMLLSDGTIKVMDFGIARFNRETDKTISEKAIGSVHYISPEQARGDATDEKSDIYSIGVMLFEMLTGRKPFDGDNPVSIALMHMQAQPKKPTDINSSIPDGLEEITLKAMQKVPSKRYQTAGEMITDIEEFKKNPSIVFEYKYFSAEEQKIKYFDKPTTSASSTGETPIQTPGGKKAKAETTPAKGVPVPKRGDYDFEDEFDDDDFYDEVIERRSPLLAILFATASVIVIMAAWLIYTIVTNTFDTIGGDELIKVPSLVGEDYDAVIAQYGGSLNLVASREFSTEYERGRIMWQSVLAGREIRIGQKIDIRVSSGPEAVELNDYEGGVLHIDEVEQRLIRQGFIRANINIRHEESTVPAGYVIRTEPRAGSMIPLDSRITVWVSFGGVNDGGTQVPDILGLTRTQAEERAKMHDVVIAFTEEYSDSVAVDRVISQDPLPMVPVDKFSTIEVVISIGPAPPKSFEINHDISREDITGDYIFEYYIDGIRQDYLTVTQNVGLNRNINWEFEGTDVSTYAIFITSVQTGNRGQFCVYEVDFTGDEVTHRLVEINAHIFAEIDKPAETTPTEPFPIDPFPVDPFPLVTEPEPDPLPFVFPFYDY